MTDLYYLTTIAIKQVCDNVVEYCGQLWQGTKLAGGSSTGKVSIRLGADRGSNGAGESTSTKKGLCGLVELKSFLLSYGNFCYFLFSVHVTINCLAIRGLQESCLQVSVGNPNQINWEITSEPMNIFLLFISQDKTIKLGKLQSPPWQ